MRKQVRWFSKKRRVNAVLMFVTAVCGCPGGEIQSQSVSKTETPEILNQLTNSVQALVKKVSPSVVQVMTAGFRPLEEGSRGESNMVVGKQRNIGSGAIIDSDGYIVTNAHVVAGAHQVQVTLSSPTEDLSPAFPGLGSRGRTLDARIVGVSNELDIALLKVEAKGLPALPIGKYDRLQQGEIVFAFGSPSGLRNSVSMGVVSAVARQLDADNPLVFIQTDAPINPGNSGGPLVDVNGELMAINTFIFSQSGGNEGLGFAIPSAVVGFAYPQLRLYGHLHRGVIGIHVQTVTPGLAAGLGLSRDWGVVIGDVVPGSPAADAGLNIQDIILAVNGRPIDNLPFFFLSFFMVNPGERVNVEVLRGTARLGFEVKVVEQQKDVDRLFDMTDPETNQIRRLGILGLTVDAKVIPLLPGLRQEEGIAVVAKTIIPGAVENSLITGDIIHALNGVPLNTLESLNTALDRLKPGNYGVLQVEREGRLIYMTFQVE
jgi:serine protease Do